MTPKVREAAVASVFPTASRARTANVCPPLPSPPIVCGLVQAANAAPSRRHSNVAARSLEAKPNVANGTPIVAPSPGPAVIDVSGGTVSRARQSSSPCVPSSAVKTIAPSATTTTSAGALPAGPGRRSPTRTVPASVPSLRQSSAPCVPSSAAK